MLNDPKGQQVALIESIIFGVSLKAAPDLYAIASTICHAFVSLGATLRWGEAPRSNLERLTSELLAQI